MRSFEVKLTANGGPAKIRFVRKDCSCFDVYREGKRLEQGDVLQFDSNEEKLIEFKLQVPRKEGVWSRSILLSELLTDGGQIPIVARTEYRVVEDLQLVPSRAVVSFDSKSDSLEVPFEVLLRTKRRMMPDELSLRVVPQSSSTHLREVAVSNGKNGVSVGDQIKEYSWNGILTVRRPEELGPFFRHERVVVAFGEGEDLITKALELKVVSREGYKAPNRIVFAKSPIGVTLSRRVQIRSGDDGVFKIKSLVCNSDEFWGEICTAGDSSAHWIRVSFSPTKLGLVQDELVVELDGESEQSLLIKLEAEGV